MNFIEKTAHEFVKQYDITPATLLSMKKLTDISAKAHYKVYRINSENDDIIQRLSLAEYCKKSIAFTYHNNNVCCIFIRTDLSDGTAAILLLHELAHIYLGHLEQSEFPAASDEAEADLFVSAVLTKVYSQKKRVHPLSYICVAISIVMMISACVTISTKQDDAAVADGSSIDYSISETVFVSKSGSKYHKADCYHIRESEVVELTVSEAEESGYEPCKDCH